VPGLTRLYCDASLRLRNAPAGLQGSYPIPADDSDDIPF
jgi:hypothetical protein